MKYMIEECMKWQVAGFLSKVDEWRMMYDAECHWYCSIHTLNWTVLKALHADTLSYSHLLESHRCLQVCWCSSGPGWMTQRKGPRGCPLPPCSPCNRQSHPSCWRRSWSWYQPGCLKAQTSYQPHAASHLTSDRVASPGKQNSHQCKGKWKTNQHPCI